MCMVYVCVREQNVWEVINVSSFSLLVFQHVCVGAVEMLAQGKQIH